jgi:hypothetical protein
VVEANWHFAGWSGDTNGCAVASSQLIVPMTQARAITGAFTGTLSATSLSINRSATDSSVVWIGADNLPVGATGALLTAASPLDGDWQAGSPFIFASTATNWSVPVFGSSNFFRLKLE